MPKPAPGSAPLTRREHRQARTTAERRLSAAQRELHDLQREVQRDLRTLRRRGETAALVARSELAEVGMRSITRLVTSLRSSRATGSTSPTRTGEPTDADPRA
jgi:hypothetical protein